MCQVSSYLPPIVRDLITGSAPCTRAIDSQTPTLSYYISNSIVSRFTHVMSIEYFSYFL